MKLDNPNVLTKKTSLLASFCLAASFAIFLSACGGDSGSDDATPPVGNDGPELTEPLQLTSTFTSTCSGCHGSKGEGRSGPKLMGTSLSLGEYKSIIRSGEGGMPAFGESVYSDEDLEADYAEFTKS